MKTIVRGAIVLIALSLLSPLKLLSNERGDKRDSITLVEAPWSKKRVESGILFKQFHFKEKSLFGSSQFISIIEIEPLSERTIEIIPSPSLVETPTLAKKSGALAAINGSFFKFNFEENWEDYNSVDYIRKGGVELAPNSYSSNSRALHQQGAIALFKGKLYILKADQLKSWESYVEADELLTSGPLLRVAGIDQPLREHPFYTTRHPRTAIAVGESGKILLFTVDGRAKESEGMTLEELQSTLRWLGAHSILNLDGGGSTTLYVKGEEEEGVVNHPSDNRKFDHKGARKVANIIVVK